MGEKCKSEGIYTNGISPPRKSSMKTSTSALSLPKLPTQCLVSSQDSRQNSSLLSPFLEKEEIPSPGQPSSISSGLEQLDDQRYVAGNVPDLSKTTAHVVIPETTTSNKSPQLTTIASTLQSVSSSQQYCTTISNSTMDAPNVPVVLDIQPVKCSMNETFSATPAKTLNTTIDLPNSSALMQNVQLDADCSTIRSDANMSLSDNVQGTHGRKGPVTSVYGFTSLTQQSGVAAGINISGVIGHGNEVLKGNSLDTTFSMAPVTALNTTIDLPGREISGFVHSPPRRTPVMKDDVPSVQPVVLGSQETETFSCTTSHASSNPHHKTSETAEQTTHSAMRMLFPPPKSSLDSTFCISDDKLPPEADHIPGTVEHF